MDYPGKVITKTQVTPTQTSASGNWTLDDQAAAIKNNNWPVALVPNPISKSLRFNSADSAYLNRTPASAGNLRTWTWSGWVKRSTLGGDQKLFQVETTNGLVYTDIKFASDIIYLDSYGGTSALQARAYTNAVYRDVGAWYHVVVVLNTPSATAADRAIIYVNGVRQAVTISDGFDQDAELLINTTNQHRIGADVLGSEGYFGGYLTEVNFIDGQALTPSDFGLTNPQTGQWIPKKYTGTYGTNGFYLNFKDATSTTTLGYDYSGNANNWTTNNFSVTAGAGNDSLTDVPTPWVAYNTTGDVGGVVRGNYATLNPLLNLNGVVATYTNGNLNFFAPTVADYYYCSTIFTGTTGKYYYEATINSVGQGILIGVIDQAQVGTVWSNKASYRNLGNIYDLSGAGVTAGNSYANNDVIGVAIDIDNGTVQFYKNNSPQGATPSFSFTAGTPLAAAGRSNNNDANVTFNFGQRPFAYTPPAGFRSLCTTNLPATTIGFGLTNQGDDYFNANLWTGTGATQSITTGFPVDFAWIKSRTTTNSHRLFDIVRGATITLSSNSTAAESTESDSLTAFTSTGYTLGADTAGGGVNTSPRSYVGWAWKAGGTGVTNTAGTITSTVSANTTSGFSIVTYTGNGTDNATVGHGLGVTPGMIIVKNRDAAHGWFVAHSGLTSGYNLQLNDTAQEFNTLSRGRISTYGSSNFTLTAGSSGTGSFDNVNQNTIKYVAYCFAPVAGYSAFGSYTGNGSADGPFVYTGFRPRYVLIKGSSFVSNWFVIDTSRSAYNVSLDALRPNLDGAEVNSPTTTYSIDILSNGFKLRTSAADSNTNGATFIWAAFAESPFQFANAR